MIVLLIAPLILYALLFLLPDLYDAMPREKADLVAGALYAPFLVSSSLYFTFVSAAMIDTFGIDTYLPDSLDLLAIILLASLMVTLVASIPLLPMRKKRGIKRLIFVIFAACLSINLVILLLFGPIGS